MPSTSLYDWGVDKPTNADKLGFQYWPMLWGGSQDKIDAFEAAIKPGLGTILLGFNECVRTDFRQITC